MNQPARRVVTLAVGLCTAWLASCGGGDNGSSTGATAAAAATPAAAPSGSGRARALAATPAQTALAAQAALARWSAPIGLSLVPVSGAVLNTGKVLFWSADVPNNETYANPFGTTASALFDPATNTASFRQVSETGHDMFCPGTARLADGRLLVNGGLTANVTSLYDPATNSWSRGASMAVGRGYNASTLLWNGSVFTMGASWHISTAAKVAEVYTPASGWRTLSGVSTANAAFLTGDNVARSDNHMWLISAGNGQVLHAGPSRTMNWIDTRGNGATTPAGLRGDDTDSMNGNAVMYEAGKILTLGGSRMYDSGQGKQAAYVIDITSGAAVTRTVAPMAYGRTFSNSVVLPNGQVVVLGGQTQPKGFSDDFAVLPAELWDPQTETFTVLPAMSVPRTYHSIGLLLPDGRVVAAGGGLCNCAADHADMQILSPPYLFNANGSAATRPVISAAPATLTYGGTASVSTDSTVTSFALVRLGATTHTVNNDQRRVAIPFTAGANNSYQLAIPTNPGILLPGQWMLFAMNANGTPSLAKMVTVSNAGAPVLQNPGDAVATTGAAVAIAVPATTSGGTLVYSAGGLPPGLSINPSTGVISGTAPAAGRYLVSVRVGNGTQTVSTDLVIRVEAPGASNSGTGLLGQYFGNTTLSGARVAQRVERPGIDLGPVCASEGGTCNVSGTQLVNFGAAGGYVSRMVTGSIACDYRALGDPLPGVPKACYAGVSGVPGGVASSNFSARWSGLIEAPSSGPTKFHVQSGAGARVWVNRQLVVDNWAAHAPAVNTGSVTLTAGQRYPILVEYFQAASTPKLQLLWQPAGESLTLVPTTRLYPGVAPATDNIALGKPATQASTYEGGVPGRAVDGNTDGSFGNGSVTHTANTAAQDWWQVDIGRKARIDLVQLWNRSDCCAERLSNFVVFVSDSDMTGRTLDQLKADPAVTARVVGTSSVTPTIGIPMGSAGRYVRVQLAGGNDLSLAEVQVFGDATIYQPPTVSAIANQQTPVGIGVSLAARATDAGGNALTYTATGLPAGLSINAQSGVISGSPTTVGTSSVTVSATNAGFAAASTGFTWTVVAALPQVVSLPAPAAASGSTVSYNPVISNGAGAQFSWNFGDGSGDTAFAATAATSHRFTAAGVYTVTLRIRASDGRINTQRFVQAISGPGATAQARASSPLLLEPRGNAAARLWVVNADNDTVSVFDTANNAKLAEVKVGTAPATLALAEDGRVWVTNRDSASISVIGPVSLAVEKTITLPRASQPFGIVINPNPNDRSALVALEGSGQVLRLHGIQGTLLNTAAVGDRPRHLAMTASGDKLFVSRFVTRPLPGEGTASVSTSAANGDKLGAEVLLLDPASLAVTRTVVLGHSERPDAENQGRGIPNYLGAAAISPDGKTAWVPSKQDNVKRGTLRDGLALNFQSTVRSISSRIDLTTLAEDLPGRVDHDNASVASAAVYHPTGAYVFVALETSRQVAVLDAVGKRELFRFEVGLAPQGLAVSANGLKLYVHNFMGRSVSAIDLQPLLGFGQTAAAPTATLATVGIEKLVPAVLKGKQLFYDARDPRLARDSYMSCASCHNDAGHDGRTWDFTGQGEGLRNTPPLKGRAGVGQGFAHWSANFDEVHDFEGQIRSLAGGTGLMADGDFNAGTRSQPLGDKKAGISADLDALAAYLQSPSTFTASPLRAANGSLTTQALAGKNVFAARNCAGCHGGPGFTLSTDASGLRNIGTLKASSGKRLGGTLAGIDPPTLRDAWATAPYLHDGSAATLADAVAAHNATSLGGSALSATELSNVVAYLQQIGSDEPDSAGLPNLALRKPATQSSVVGGASASRAVDGNTSGNSADSSYTHTNNEWSPWWQVDLQTSAVIDTIRLWNRTDCCASRLSNFTVFVSGTDMTGRTLAQLNADTTVWKTKVASLNGASNITLPARTSGRFVRVQLDALQYLTLAEVQVYGLPVTNLALGKPATQSSVDFSGWAERAVDGRTDGIYPNNSVTHTGNGEASPWWQVDLQSGAIIDTVRIWNRTDCCATRLSNFTVFVSNTDMTGRTLAQLNADASVRKTKVASLNGADNITLNVRNSGRYVRVQLDAQEYLSLAEVQVFGR